MSTEDMVQGFAPALRTNAQAEAFRISLQILGDLCGFGLSFFDLAVWRCLRDRPASPSSHDSTAPKRTPARSRYYT